MFDYTKTAGQNEPADLERIVALAQEQIARESRVAELETQLKAAQSALSDIRDHELPGAMKTLGLTELRLQTGQRVEIKEVVRTSVAKARVDAAVEWLEGNNLGRIVKRSFEIFFDRAEIAWAEKFERDLAKRKRQLDVRRSQWIEPQTINKVVRELLEAGADVPMDLFGVHLQDVAKIVPAPEHVKGSAVSQSRNGK